MKNENLRWFSDSMASEGVATVELLSEKHIKMVNFNFLPKKRLQDSLMRKEL